MLKLFFNLAYHAKRGAPGPDGRDDAWIRDPLAHPDIAVMDERQRADLPFVGLARTADRCVAGQAGQGGQGAQGGQTR